MRSHDEKIDVLFIPSHDIHDITEAEITLLTAYAADLLQDIIAAENLDED